VGPVASSPTPGDESDETGLARLGLRFTNWAERWFPDAYIFVTNSRRRSMVGGELGGIQNDAFASV
jgi:hypothetical protein